MIRVFKGSRETKATAMLDGPSFLMMELNVSKGTFKGRIQNAGSSMHIQEAHISGGIARIVIDEGTIIIEELMTAGLLK